MFRATRFTILILFVLVSIFAVSAIQADTFYFRWSSAPGVTCSTVAGGVQVSVDPQHYEYNLPAGAFVSDHDFQNGIDFNIGTFPATAGNSSAAFLAFSVTLPSYPATYAERLTTIIDGNTVYTSTYSASCSGDGTASVTLSNVEGGAGGAALFGGCPVQIPTTAVQGRIVATINALFAPRADTGTNVVLNAGSSWWIIDTKDGFYELWIACQATPVWVPADAVTPNYDPSWGGAALPSSSS